MKLPGFPIVSFKNADELRLWLEKNHKTSNGMWLRFFKKNSSTPTVKYSEAVEEALCFGWIDSQVQKYDEESYLQKFTPRRSKSIWSKINTARVEQLIEDGRMKPAGLKEVELAKQDGRWEKAYHPPSAAIIPEDFLKELSKNKKAKECFERLNKTNTYAIFWRLSTAKNPETRSKRIEAIISMLSKGETFHP